MVEIHSHFSCRDPTLTLFKKKSKNSAYLSYFVKMHDVLRDVALWIAKKKYGAFILFNFFKELKKRGEREL